MAIPVPDFTGLAHQQGQINQGVAGQQTLANRPDQWNEWGSTRWSQDPATGQWTQSNTMSPQGQQLFGQAVGGQSTLAGDIARGLNYEGIPGLAGAAGSAQNVIDANMALMNPQLKQARDRENARLAAMGLTMGSQAYNDTQRNLGNSESDAYQKAILAGTTEYGNIFNRALQARQQGVSERNNMYGADIQGLSALGTLKDSLDPSKHNPAFASATGYTPENVYAAGMDTYNAGLARENADLARTTADRNALIGLAGTALQGQGGNIVNTLGNLANSFGSQMGDWWNDISGWFNSGSGTSA